MIEVKFKKPLAALLCSGVVDIADIGVNVGTSSCLVLVHAIKGADFPLPFASFNTVECSHAALMAEALGLVTDEQLKLGGAIIGSFFADPIPEGYESPWAYGCDPSTSCRVVAPLFLNKPVDGLTQLDFSEARNGFAVIPPAILEPGTELSLPVKESIFSRANPGAEFIVPLDDKYAGSMFSTEWLRQYTRLTVTCGGYFKTFVFEPENEVIYGTDVMCENETVFSAMRGENIALPFFKFHLKTQLV